MRCRAPGQCVHSAEEEGAFIGDTAEMVYNGFPSSRPVRAGGATGKQRRSAHSEMSKARGCSWALGERGRAGTEILNWIWAGVHVGGGSAGPRTESGSGGTVGDDTISGNLVRFAFLLSNSAIMTGSYNNFFRMFDRNTRRDITLEASRESSKPRAILKPRKVCTGGKRKKDEISVDSLDFNKKILHTAWHPMENIIAVAATNNLYIFQDKIN